MFYNNDKIQTPDTELGEVPGSSALSVPAENAVANPAAASPTGISNACCIGIAAGVTLLLTLIPITTFLIVYYTRKDKVDESPAPQKLLDNGTMCSSKAFIQTQSSIEEWLYSVDENVQYVYPAGQCYNNLTCVQNTITRYTNFDTICNSMNFFPGNFGNGIYDIKCKDIHIALNSDQTCSSNSTVGYLEDGGKDIFLCPNFVPKITLETPDIYARIDLMNLLFAQNAYNGSNKVLEYNSTIAGASCNSFAYNADSSPSYNESALLCMTELYLACN